MVRHEYVKSGLAIVLTIIFMLLAHALTWEVDREVNSRDVTGREDKLSATHGNNAMFFR